MSNVVLYATREERQALQDRMRERYAVHYSKLQRNGGEPSVDGAQHAKEHEASSNDPANTGQDVTDTTSGDKW